MDGDAVVCDHDDDDEDDDDEINAYWNRMIFGWEMSGRHATR